MPINGLGQATIPIVGFNYGAGKPERIRQVIRTELPIAAGVALVGTILFEAFPGTLLGMFSASEEAMAIGVPGLRMIAVTFVFGSVTTVLGYVCAGLGNGMVSMLGTGLRQLVPLIPLAFLFGRLGGIGSIWYTMWISEALAALCTVLSAGACFASKDVQHPDRAYERFEG